MALDFPNSPAPGDFFTYDQTTWQWDGSVWALVPTNYDPNDLLPYQTGHVGEFLTTNGSTATWSPLTPAGLTPISASSFSGVSEVNLDSVFSSAYDNYRVIFAPLSATRTGKWFGRLRSSGVTNTTSVYSSQVVTTTTASTRTNESYFAFGGSRYTHTSISYSQIANIMTLDFGSPYRSDQPTTWTGTFHGNSYAYGSTESGFSGGNYANNNSFDGINVYFETSGAVMSGTISVYGYKNI